MVPERLANVKKKISIVPNSPAVHRSSRACSAEIRRRLNYMVFVSQPISAKERKIEGEKMQTADISALRER